MFPFHAISPFGIFGGYKTWGMGDSFVFIKQGATIEGIGIIIIYSGFENGFGGRK